MEEWLSEIDQFTGSFSGIHKLLVGNKADLEKRVDYYTALRFSEKLGIPFLETSAKTATNVESAFLTMAKELISNREMNRPPNTITDGQQSNKSTVIIGEGNHEKSKCC